jgi:hypothetical protein
MEEIAVERVVFLPERQSRLMGLIGYCREVSCGRASASVVLQYY